MEALIHSNERLDDLCRKGYRLIQDPKLFCFGIDAVLLSDYAKVKRGERAVDLCTGNGVIPILLEAKNNGEHYSGLELQPQCADLARRSVKYNHLEDKVTIEEGDVCNASELFGRESVEVVTVNPPYMIGQHGIKNADDAMTIARHEVRCTLDDIVRESAKMLKFNGRFYMVHRPFRLAEIFSHDDEISYRAKAHASCTSLRGQGAKHGAYRGVKGRQKPYHHRKTVSCIQGA